MSMCEDHFRPVTQAMLEEPASYGLDCSDTSGLEVYNMINADRRMDEITEGASGFTFILICICLFLVATLCLF